MGCNLSHILQSPNSHRISIIWGPCVILKSPPPPQTSEFRAVLSQGISEACDFALIYRLVSRIRCQGFESPALWSMQDGF